MFTRTGIIKKIGNNAIMLEMTDTKESIIWPLSPTSNSNLPLEVGTELSLGISNNKEASTSILTKSSIQKNMETKGTRALLEKIIN